LIFHSQIKKKTYFLLHLYRFVYKTKTANAAIKKWYSRLSCTEGGDLT